jgi:hypothetical protein
MRRAAARAVAWRPAESILIDSRWIEVRLGCHVGEPGDDAQ